MYDIHDWMISKWQITDSTDHEVDAVQTTDTKSLNVMLNEWSGQNFNSNFAGRVRYFSRSTLLNPYVGSFIAIDRFIFNLRPP